MARGRCELALHTTSLPAGRRAIGRGIMVLESTTARGTWRRHAVDARHDLRPCASAEKSSRCAPGVPSWSRAWREVRPCRARDPRHRRSPLVVGEKGLAARAGPLKGRPARRAATPQAEFRVDEAALEVPPMSCIRSVSLAGRRASPPGSPSTRPAAAAGVQGVAPSGGVYSRRRRGLHGTPVTRGITSELHEVRRARESGRGASPVPDGLRVQGKWSALRTTISERPPAQPHSSGTAANSSYSTSTSSAASRALATVSAMTMAIASDVKAPCR